MTINFNKGDSQGHRSGGSTEKRGSFQSGGQTKQMPPRPRISTGRPTKTEKSGK